MSMAILADFLSVKKSLGQQLFIALIVGSLIGLASGSIYIVPPMTMFMIAIGQGIALVALDEQNGWQSYRSTLPVTRTSLVFARLVFIVALAIAFLVVGTVVAAAISFAAPYLVNVEFLNAVEVTFSVEDLAVACASSLAIMFVMLGVGAPIIAKYGMSNAVRVMPLAFVFLFLAVMVLGSAGDGAILSGIDALFNMAPVAVTCVIMVILGAAVCVVGAYIAARFYEIREF